jgi:hypothetical protein
MMTHRERVGFGLVLSALLITQLSCGDSSGPGLIPSTLEANSSTTQSAAPGTDVSEPPSVIVRDQNGATLAGVTVTFAVSTGGGSVTGGSAVSDASGVATVGSWTLGTAEGANTLTASSGNLHVTFTANGADPCVVTATHTIGTPTNGQLTLSDCAYADGSFVDFIGTTVPSAGAYVFSQSAGQFDTFMLLYTADGSPVAVNDDFGTETNSRIKAILPAGNYVIAANSFELHTIGSYTITSQFDGTSITNCEEVFALRGSTTTQTLETTDCPRTGGFYGDEYFILIPAGQSITVSMTSTAVDSYLLIYDLSGNQLAANDDKDGTTKDAQLVFTSPVSAFYRVFPSSANAGATGAYTIAIQ